MGIDSHAVARRLTQLYYPFRLLTMPRAVEAVRAIRTFETLAGESVTLVGGKGRDYLYVVEGAVTLTHDLSDPVTAAADDENDHPLFLPPAPYKATVSVAQDAVFCVAESLSFDTLMLWDELTHCASGDAAICGRMQGVRQALAFSVLPPEGWLTALGRMTTVALAKGSEVDGQPPLAILAEGSATVTDGERKVIRELMAGDVFGGAIDPTAKRVVMTSAGTVHRLERGAFDAIVAAGHVAEIEPNDAVLQIDAGAKLLDIRYAMEREESAIPGSLFIPLHDLQERMCELDPDITYVVYCRSGRRSKAAVALMARAGREGVSLKGGIIGWPFDIEGDTF
ncbi:MAG: hypothetical protein HQK87_01680 [Nitrospinae bacterium]|nr:hypothetical protein [Nitrospinota bacterium]